MSSTGRAAFESQIGPINRSTFSADMGRRVKTYVRYPTEGGRFVAADSRGSLITPAEPSNSCDTACLRTVNNVHNPVPQSLWASSELTAGQLKGTHEDGTELTADEGEDMLVKMVKIALWTIGTDVTNIAPPGQNSSCKCTTEKHKVAYLDDHSMLQSQESGNGWGNSALSHETTHDCTLQPLANRRLALDVEPDLNFSRHVPVHTGFTNITISLIQPSRLSNDIDPTAPTVGIPTFHTPSRVTSLLGNTPLSYLTTPGLSPAPALTLGTVSYNPSTRFTTPGNTEQDDVQVYRHTSTFDPRRPVDYSGTILDMSPMMPEAE